jgi:2-dehydropantoate 2-reductase
MVSGQNRLPTADERPTARRTSTRRRARSIGTMRIGVIGAGAVGGAVAALLARGGHDVEVTARGEHLAAIRARGIHLTGGWGEYTALVEANDVLAHGPELAIVATKAQDAVAALRDNAAILHGIPIVVVQNGLGSIAAAQAAAPRSDVVGGLAMFASSYLSPGEITITTGGPIYLGGDTPDDDVPARYALSVLGPVMDAKLVPNFVGAQWTKLVVNMVNALPAITGMSAQAVIADKALRRLLTASIRETVRIGLASGVRFESLQGLSHGRLRLLSVLPLWVGQVVPLLMRVRLGKVPNPGSTLQSIRRGQRTEIDHLNGAVVEAARAIGRDAPINAALTSMVHEVESSGQFISADEVVRRI